MNHRRRIVLVVLGLLAAALVPLAAPPPAMAAGTVNVVVQGQGSVTDGGEINCTQSGGPDCSADYADTTYQECDPELRPPCWDVTETAVATLTAGAGTNGFVFDRWTGCESPSGSTCTHTVSSSVTITAVYRDNTAPTVSPPQPSSGIRRGTVLLTTTAGDNSGSVTKVEFFNGASKIGEDSSAPYELSWNTTTVADGVKSITARAYDAAGNQTTSGASGFTVDNTAPTVAVTSGPDGQTFGSGITQTWQFTTGDATSGVASRACSVVASGSPASFGACSGFTSHSVSGLPGGAYEFVVRVTDVGGLTTTSAPRTFTIDDVAPATSVTSGPAHGSRVRTRTVRFGFGSSEAGSTFECRVAPSGVTAPFDACSDATTHTAAGLADGAYVFSVRATDQFGNVDATPVTRTFTVDTLAPQTTIRSGPASIVRTAGSTARVTFWVTSERYATFRCKLDARAWRSCASRPAYVVGLGAHTLRVAAVDRAGNVDRTPAVRRWTVRRR